MARIQRLALEQISDQALHLVNVFEDVLPHGFVIEQFQRNLGARQWRSQLVADRQHQLPFCLQHALHVISHAVDVLRQVTEFVSPLDRDPVV